MPSSFDLMKLEETRERILLDELEKGRQTAVAEVAFIIERHENHSVYPFEYGGQKMSAMFIQACLETDHHPPNAYRIEMVASHDTLVDGDCFITDSHDRKVQGNAITMRGNSRNMIFIRALANKFP